MRFLFRQKFRIEKGMSLTPAVNLTLLAISASDRIERAVAIRTSILIPTIVLGTLGMVWVAGFIMTRSSMQAAEDEALRDVCAWRRKLDPPRTIKEDKKLR